MVIKYSHKENEGPSHISQFQSLFDETDKERKSYKELATKYIVMVENNADTQIPKLSRLHDIMNKYAVIVLCLI